VLRLALIVLFPVSVHNYPFINRLAVNDRSVVGAYSKFSICYSSVRWIPMPAIRLESPGSGLWSQMTW